MLAEIPAQMHKRDVLRKLFRQLGAYRFAVIFGAVIDQNDLEGCRSKNLCGVLNQRTDGAAAVINGNHER